MATVIPLGTEGANNGASTTVLRLQQSTGSGDVLLLVTQTYNGSGPYQSECAIAQGPTVSGPWVPVVPPYDVSLTAPTTTDDPPSTDLRRISWSQPFLQTTITNGASSTAAAVLITPPPNQLGKPK